MPDTRIEITETDRQLAREVMCEAWEKCEHIQFLRDPERLDCDCNPGRIDGCKARVEAIARAIAAARKP